jgi:hypothetical protein
MRHVHGPKRQKPWPRLHSTTKERTGLKARRSRGRVRRLPRIQPPPDCNPELW